MKVTEMERGDCSEDSRSTEYKYSNVTYCDQWSHKNLIQNSTKKPQWEVKNEQKKYVDIMVKVLEEPNILANTH
jgi:hypothetical protein